jgi:hypothetical protein
MPTTFPVKGFAPTCREPQGRTIGTVECWNIGKMAFVKLQNWINDIIHLDHKIKMDIFF